MYILIDTLCLLNTYVGLDTKIERKAILDSNISIVSIKLKLVYSNNFHGILSSVFGF